MSRVEVARVDPSDLRLLAPAVLAWAVAAATLGSGWGTRVLVVAGSVLVMGVVVVLARRDMGGRARGLPGPLALSVVLLALLQAAAFGQGVVRERGGVRELADERAVVVAEVVLTGDPVRVASRDGEARVLRDGTVQVLTGRGRTRAASAPVLLTGGPVLVGPGWRATVLVRGRLGPLDRADDRLATLAVSGPVRVLSPPGPVAGAAERLRSGLRAAVDHAPADARGLLPGLVIGDTSRTPPDLTEAMLATGMTHLTAVSGSNVPMRLFTGIRESIVLAAVVVTASALTPSTTEATGPLHWDKPVLTVRVVDAAAWAGTDVQGALDEWAPAIRMTLTDDVDADITLEAGNAQDALGGDSVAATATKDTEGAVITGCRVGLDVDRAGTDVEPLLAHELGHCLGLGHTSGVEGGSVMHWFAQDYQGGWSDTVTTADLERARSLYR